MPKFSLLLCILFIGAYQCTAQEPKDKLERLMNYYATHDNFNGTVLVARHGAVLMAKGYGYRDERSRIKNNENTVFQLGSNTEQFTAEVFVQLDSKGKLSLEDKVIKYIPGYPYGDRISLKNLLTHTSGIYDYTSDPILSKTHPERALSKEQILGRFKNVPLAFEPGTRVEYSNSNYFLLGLIIERITHRKYEAEVRENILHTCGMGRSGFDFARLRDADKAIGYYYEGGERYAEAPITDSNNSYAAGALYTTAGDLLKWHRAVEHHKLLPKDWQDLAYSPFKSQYALGWIIDNIYGRRFMEHAGAITGFANYEIREENDDLFIVLLENCERAGATDEEIAKNILQCLYDKSYQIPGERKVATVKTSAAATQEPVKKKGKAVNTEQLKKYVGEFEITPAFTLTFTIAGNELVGASPDQKSIKMIPESETMFRIAGMNDEIEFVKEKNGKVNRIVLHQKGELIPGERSK